MGRGARIVLAGLGVAVALIGAAFWSLRDGVRPRAELAGPASEAAVTTQTRATELATLLNPSARSDARGAGNVAVSVVSDGRAVEGARVLVHGTGLAPLTTDDDGRCTLALAPQRALDLEVTADGCCGLRDEFTWADDVVVELPPCTPIAGRVLDRATREPLAGARVHVWREKRWVPLAAEAVTDVDGRFRIECAPRGAGVQVSASGHPDWPEVERRPTSDGLELLLVARPTLEVQVVEHGTRLPIAGAEVNGCCTDAEGRTHVPGPEDPRALFEIGAAAEGFCSIAWGEFPERLPETLVLELPRGAYFEGVVRDEAGRPVPGASVDFDSDGAVESAGLPALPRGCSYLCLTGGRTASDDNGNYRMGPLTPGSGHYAVEVQHPVAGVCRTAAQRAGESGSVSRLDVTLTPLSKGVIEGRVLLNGAGIFPADVFCSDGWDTQKVDPDLDGTYRFEGVAAGIVQLALRSKSLEPIRALLPELETQVRVVAGATTLHDFVFEVPFADVGGRVTYANGEPAHGKKLRVEHASGYDNDDTSGSDGRWSERVPDVGWEYDVVVEHGDEQLRVSGVRAGDGAVNFVLPMTACLPVRVVDADSGNLVERVRYSWQTSDGTVRRGSARRAIESATFVLEVYPGTISELTVEAEDDAYPAGRRSGIELAPGDNAPLEMRLQKGHDLVIELAPGLEDPGDGELIFLLEAELWGAVRAANEQEASPTFSAGDARVAYARGAVTDVELRKRMLSFDAGTAHLHGLAPGRYRFKAFPAGTTVEPAEVEIPHEGRLVLSWARGN